MEELEDTIARQLAVLEELKQMRRAATDTQTKAYLHAQEQQALAVLNWLRELRREMQHGPK